MRVGIVTFHRALNYGALLQAYALKTAIKKIGAEAEIIDYRNDMLERLYAYPGFFAQAGTKNKLRYLLYSGTEKRKRKRFTAFRTQYLGLEETPGLCRNEVRTREKSFDLFFAGSDQVWSPDAHGLDETFFLDFVSEPAKKRSYAASFGVSSIKTGLLEEYRRLLSGYAICSVREPQGQAILQAIGNIPSRVDVDPVFLLSKEEWRAVLHLTASTESYAVVYSFGLTPAQVEMAAACYRAGMKILMVGASVRNPLSVPCRFVGDLGPQEFAQLLYGADFLITNSFHGTALAVIYHVPFALDYLTGAASKANSRLENIIQITGLSDRVMGAGIHYDKLCEAAVPWEQIDKRLLPYKEDSYSYLERCINP